MPRTTLQDRRAGKHSRRDCIPPLKRLDKLEEKAIVKRTLKETTEVADIWPLAICVDSYDRRCELWSIVFARNSIENLFR